MNDTVLVSRDGPVATLTLNRPDALNTLDDAMVEALVARTMEVAADDRLRVVVLAGAGRHFMAGGDIRSFAATLEDPPAARERTFRRLVERVHCAIEQLHRMPHPLVGRVHGAVAGFGLSLMNACDLVVAADDAYFASAYRHIGLSPDGGGSWSLPRLVGQRKAMEIMLLAGRFDAGRGVAPGPRQPGRARAPTSTAATASLVASLVAAPLTALRNTTRLLRASPANTLSAQLQAEAVSFGQCAATADFVEGIGAFMAKRTPQFGRGETGGP